MIELLTEHTFHGRKPLLVAHHDCRSGKEREKGEKKGRGSSSFPGAATSGRPKTRRGGEGGSLDFFPDELSVEPRRRSRREKKRKKGEEAMPII